MRLRTNEVEDHCCDKWGLANPPPRACPPVSSSSHSPLHSLPAPPAPPAAFPPAPPSRQVPRPARAPAAAPHLAHHRHWLALPVAAGAAAAPALGRVLVLVCVGEEGGL